MEEKIKNSKNLVKYTDSEDLAKRTVSDKILKNKAYEISVNPKYDWYQRELASMLYNSFDKKTGLVTKININDLLTQELQTPVI